MRHRMLLRVLYIVLIGGSFSPCASSQTGTFRCGVELTSSSSYSVARAGWDLRTQPHVANGVCSSTAPFYFSTKLAEGSYRVSIVFGGPSESTNTVKAESRRLMIESLHVHTARTETREFNVHVHMPQFFQGDRVLLTSRETGTLRWDDKLTLEFNGDHPSIREIRISKSPESLPVVYLIGDSTVVDQDHEPWSGWGQMLPRFFGSGVVIANFAESGESARRFNDERRLHKIVSLLKPGDYVFIQFGHNDQKSESVNEFHDMLRDYVTQVRERGATPVLVTPMVRRSFEGQGHIRNTLGEYPETMRSLAREQKVALIDLNAMSQTLVEAMGPEGSKAAYMNFAADTFPNQPMAIADDTHFNRYGAYEMARCVVNGIRTLPLPLKDHLAQDVAPFDPAHPDAPDAVRIPPSPMPYL